MIFCLILCGHIFGNFLLLEFMSFGSFLFFFNFYRFHFFLFCLLLFPFSNQLTFISCSESFSPISSPFRPFNIEIILKLGKIGRLLFKPWLNTLNLLHDWRRLLNPLNPLLNMLMILINLRLNISQILNNGLTLLSHLFNPFHNGRLFLQIELFQVNEDFGGLLG